MAQDSPGWVPVADCRNLIWNSGPRARIRRGCKPACTLETDRHRKSLYCRNCRPDSTVKVRRRFTSLFSATEETHSRPWVCSVIACSCLIISAPAVACHSPRALTPANYGLSGGRKGRGCYSGAIANRPITPTFATAARTSGRSTNSLNRFPTSTSVGCWATSMV